MVRHFQGPACCCRNMLINYQGTHNRASKVLIGCTHCLQVPVWQPHEGLHDNEQRDCACVPRKRSAPMVHGPCCTALGQQLSEAPLVKVVRACAWSMY